MYLHAQPVADIVMPEVNIIWNVYSRVRRTLCRLYLRFVIYREAMGYRRFYWPASIVFIINIIRIFGNGFALLLTKNRSRVSTRGKGIVNRVLESD